MNLVIPSYMMFAFAFSQAWTETRFPTLVGLSVPCALTILRRHFPTCRFPSASFYSFASGKTLKTLQLWAEVLSAFLFWSCVPFSFLLCFLFCLCIVVFFKVLCVFRVSCLGGRFACFLVSAVLCLTFSRCW